MQSMLIRMLLAATLLLAPTASFAANCCALNGGVCNTIPPMIHGQSPWTGAVCGSTITGTNCTAVLDADVSASSGSCLTIGSSVTLDLAGFELECTSGSCGAAITNTSSGGGSNAVVIKNGDIKGPWTTGINVTGGTNSSVSEVLVDGAVTGLVDVRGKIDHTVVRNCTTLGIELYPGEDLESVVVRNNGNTAADGHGVLLNGSVSSSSFDNVLFIDNRHHLHWDFASGVPAVQRSEFQDSVTCDCDVDSGFGSFCNPAEYCTNITNSTTPTIIDDRFLP